MFKTLILIDRYLEECLFGIATSIMASLVFLQILMRYLLHAPMSWSDEIAVYCLTWSVYIAASWAVRERAHIRMMSFIAIFPNKVRLAFVCFSDLIWFLTCAFMSWQGYLLQLSFWQQPYESPVLGIDQKWPYLIVVLSFSLMMFRLSQVYYTWFRYGQRPDAIEAPNNE